MVAEEIAAYVRSSDRQQNHIRFGTVGAVIAASGGTRKRFEVDGREMASVVDLVTGDEVAWVDQPDPVILGKLI